MPTDKSNNILTDETYSIFIFSLTRKGKNPTTIHSRSPTLNPTRAPWFKPHDCYKDCAYRMFIWIMLIAAGCSISSSFILWHHHCWSSPHVWSRWACRSSKITVRGEVSVVGDDGGLHHRILLRPNQTCPKIHRHSRWRSPATVGSSSHHYVIAIDHSCDCHVMKQRRDAWWARRIWTTTRSLSSSSQTWQDCSGGGSGSGGGKGNVEAIWADTRGVSTVDCSACYAIGRDYSFVIICALCWVVVMCEARAVSTGR